MPYMRREQTAKTSESDAKQHVPTIEFHDKSPDVSRKKTELLLLPAWFRFRNTAKCERPRTLEKGVSPPPEWMTNRRRRHQQGPIPIRPTSSRANAARLRHDGHNQVEIVGHELSQASGRTRTSQAVSND